MIRSYSNINTSRNGNKNINKNNSSASTSRIQSVSSDTVFENSDLDVVNPAQISQKSGRNLSSSSDVPSNKIVKTSEKSIFSSSNRYSLLTIDDNCEIGNPPQHSANEVPDEIIEPVKPPPSPPPIIVNGINDFVRLRSELIKLIGSENFLFKSSTNNLKIITKNSDSYRSVVKFLNDQGAEYHTYQQRENKAFRIVIRNIHPSTPTNEVGIAIQEIGFTVRQVVNVRHKITKLALPIFFVDLEPAEINKDVFHVTHILHTKIKIEEPHKHRELVQCFNCQKYGHSKTYCSHPPRCVGCAANHPSSSCNKTKDQPPTCALCGGNHPANYRGCTVHKNLQKLKNGPKTTIKYNVKEGKASADKIPSDPPSFNLNDDKIFPNLAQTYPQNLPKSSNPNPNWHTHNTPPENNLTSQLSSFITELKSVFDRVWHIGLLYKLKLFLPAPYYLLIRSYLCNRSFAVRQGNLFSSYFSIQAGVPQGSDLAPDLFNIYTSDIPKVANTTIATYADDTAILASNTDLTLASSALQNHLDLINSWATQWRIKINPEKSYNVIFSLRKNDFPPLQLQGVDIPKTSQVKYLGLILDKRPTWGPHLKSKRKTLNNRLHLLRPILKSKMSIHTKSVLYKSLLRPIWAYGMQIWGCAKPSQIRSIQAFQSISLRLIASAPWYITNKALHKDLKIDTVDQLAQNYYAKFHVKLRHHPNPLISHPSSHTLPDNPPRRLKRRWCRDLLN
ncbi:hypothetical protein QTP88_003654 [Uroleucon formosanum]